jgi:copper chaperone CopZ
MSVVMLLSCAALAWSDDSTAKDAKEPKTTKATFMVTGLHCPPCTKTVEDSLSKAKGIRSIKVDWKTKLAHVDFNEEVLPAQRVAQLLAATPHMMGGDMHYAGWLAIKLPEAKDPAEAKLAKESLSKAEGVKQVTLYPDEQLIGVSFDPKKGKLATKDLISKLKVAGIKAELLE